MHQQLALYNNQRSKVKDWKDSGSESRATLLSAGKTAAQIKWRGLRDCQYDIFGVPEEYASECHNDRC